MKLAVNYPNFTLPDGRQAMGPTLAVTQVTERVLPHLIAIDPGTRA